MRILQAVFDFLPMLDHHDNPAKIFRKLRIPNTKNSNKKSIDPATCNNSWRHLGESGKLIEKLNSFSSSFRVNVKGRCK